LFFSRAPFLAADGLTYIDQVWNGAQSFEQGTPIVVGSADVSGINAVMTRAVIVSGHVSDASGLVPVGGFEVNALDATVACCQFIGGAQTDAQGNYSIAVAPGVSVKVDFGVFSGPPPGTRYLPQWWNNKTSFDAADPILATADVPNINARLANGFLITGHVTERGSGAALAGMHVQVFDPAVPCCPFREIAHSETSATGDYTVVLTAGSYKVQFSEFPQPAVRPHLTQWWQDKPSFETANTINALIDVSGINADLETGFILSGHVSDAGGTTSLGGIGVNANDATMGCCQFIVGTQTDASGNYRLIVPAGRLIRVFFGTNPAGGVRYLPQWWNGKPFFDQADDIAMTQDRPGVDAHLALGVLIHGRVTDSTGTIPVVGLNVSAQDAAQGCCRFVGGAQTNLDGRYTMVVPSGHDVKIEFGLFNPTPGSPYLGQWYRNKPDFGSADPVSTSSDEYNIDASLESGFLIRGTVTGPSGPVANVFVSASLGGAGTFCCQGVGGANTDATGQFQIRVRSGTYRIQVNPQPSTHLQQQWWNGVPGGTVYFDRASDIVVGSADATGKNFTLVAGTLIQGHLSEAGTGQPIGGIGINADDADAVCCEALAFTASNPEGSYAVVVPFGSHIRMFFGSGPDRRYIEQWWDNKPFFNNADIIDATSDQPAIDAHMMRAVVISGHVTNSAGSIPVAGLQVNALDGAVECCQFIGGAQTDAQGNYSFSVA